MLEAQRLCEQRGLEFCTVFAHQYILSKKDHPEPEGWGGPIPLMGWQLSHCRNLDCRDIVDAMGQQVGWLLGVAVDPDGIVVSQRGILLNAALKDRTFWKTVEETVSGLAGKFIAVLLTSKGQRVYFDPVMDMPSVFNSKTGIVAASPLLAINREVKENPRIPYSDIQENGGNYGFQQTCDKDVLRGLSNHYLDLKKFTLHRHWPLKSDKFEDDFESPEEAAEQIIQRLGQITSALITNHVCAMPISGGNDSRTLIYSARDALGRLDHAYSHRINWMTKFDCYLAKKLADKLGLELQIIDAVRGMETGEVSRFKSRQLAHSFKFATGYMKPPKRAELLGYHMIPETELVLRGNIMDMSRANQWPRETLEFDLAHAIDKLVIGGCPPEKRVSRWKKDYVAWMETLPENARTRTYEFAFTEQLLPNTLGARLLGFGRANYINPFNDRSLITACMKVSPELRKKGTFNTILREVSGAPKTMRAKRLGKKKHLHAEVDQLFA